MNMKQWLNQLAVNPRKKPLPILSFPGIQAMESVTVKDLVQSDELQAECIYQVATRVDAAAAVGFMDLSVEAEAFGAQTILFDEDVPAVTGALITSYEEAEALPIPKVTGNRCQLFTNSISLAKKKITDKPIFAGIIGPFSLAGRLVDVSEAMINCCEEPEMMHLLLEKASDFLIDYALAFKAAGANGVMMAEPLAGLLSPTYEKEFSTPYVRKIAQAVQDDDFLVIYHNCGNYTSLMTESLASNGCCAYHFGNAVNMEEMLQKMPADKPVMGNLDPADQFREGTPESVRMETAALMETCSKFPNFIPSSGCDIPPMSPWENICAFFNAVEEFYDKSL